VNKRYWITSFFVILFLITSSFFVFNIFVDPYGLNNFFSINKINENKTQTDAQSRIYKLRLLKQQENVEGLFLGGSRATFLGNTEKIEKLTGKNFYNFAMNEQEIFEMYHYLQDAIKEFEINELVISLDTIQFDKKRSLFNQEHPKVLNTYKNDFKYYLSYKTFIDSMKTVYKNMTDRPLIYSSDGWKVVNIFDYYNIKVKDQDKYLISALNLNNKWSSIKKTFKIDMDKLYYFYKIIDLCKDNNIDVKVFFNPIYKLHYFPFYSQNKIEIQKLKMLISDKTEFYDFTSMNVITKDYHNFIDSVSHPQQYLSNHILDYIYSSKRYDDFGFLVNKLNINEYFKDFDEKFNKEFSKNVSYK